MKDILLVKIGGSTLGSHDTTLEDVVSLQRRGLPVVMVHGGGALISRWLSLHDLPTRFERGLRVTDAQALEVVTAVLAGLVNKRLVASLAALGGRAVGLSGVDGGLLRGRVLDEALGLVGEITEVKPRPLLDLLQDGFVPVVAPIALEWQGGHPTGRLLNVNADTAAGAVARALSARWLAFLTDVPAVRGAGGEELASLSAEEAARLMAAGAIEGGMLPKVEACLAAAAEGCRCLVVDGRRPHVLIDAVEGQAVGTCVG